MKLIVGLGNPGPAYEKTRHNAGFLVVDRLAERHARHVIPRARFQSLTVEASIPASPEPQRVLLMKPTTYMNLSGQAVAEAVRFYKLTPDKDVFILVDDVYLPCGSLRVRADGGAGGHNGLASIARALGGDRYPRCRIGVDQPGLVPQADYVLGRFSADQWSLVDPALNRAADAAELWAARGLDAAMNRFNAKEPPQQSPNPATTPAQRPVPSPESQPPPARRRGPTDN